MSLPTYKHSATVSSQVFFCSSPIRLDSYNRCQFGCTYCFSRNRSRDTSNPGLTAANAAAFASRMQRVTNLEIRSAFDEFLAARVPIQFGGMQDPFSLFDLKHKVSQQLLKVLIGHDYPTIISTKSPLVVREPYLSMLREANVLVRLSAAGVSEQFRSQLEIGCPSSSELLDTIGVLSVNDIPTSLRIQPVIPGQEDHALALANKAISSGVKHVSFEYLKVGTEEMDESLRRVSRAVRYDVWELIQERGTKRLGRDYTLRTAAKRSFLREARNVCKAEGASFGAGDTEFIHLSDGIGCCNGSSQFLNSASQFTANFVGVLKHRRVGDRVAFSDFDSMWKPSHNMHQYLTTNSRGRADDPSLSSWMALLSHRWNGGRSPYSPGFFAGVQQTEEFDPSGHRYYKIESLWDD